MEQIKVAYYIMGIIVIVIGFIGQILYMKFEIKQVKKDQETGFDRVIKDSNENDSRTEKTRQDNIANLREIYDQKIADAKNYAKGLFEQRLDSLNNLQIKVDKIEKKLDDMVTQKSVDQINESINNLIGLIMSQRNKRNDDTN